MAFVFFFYHSHRDLRDQHNSGHISILHRFQPPGLVTKGLGSNLLAQVVDVMTLPSYQVMLATMCRQLLRLRPGSKSVADFGFSPEPE